MMMDYEDDRRLPAVPERAGPATIPLGVLLDYAVQQLFHEVTVLSELLPKKLDGDRKVSIVTFAASTRLLAVKLLAVVKYIRSARKFEACSSISFYLDQLREHFIETADRLVELSRQDLVVARLPTFHIVEGVDVLSNGTYARLPQNIKKRFIKEKPITQREQARTLSRLNQALQWRVAKAAAKLSPRIQSIDIRNGMVKMWVPGEFRVCLTVLGDYPQLPWALLHIEMDVKDPEVGQGHTLVHPLQVNFIHELVQTRMNASKEPLTEMYNILHAFAQGLQVEVLFCQATQLCAGALRNCVAVEKYDIEARKLVVGYWMRRQGPRGQSARFSPMYRIEISGDDGSGATRGGLRVRHSPPLSGLPELDTRPGRLSMSRLLGETMYGRVRERLMRVRGRLIAGLAKEAEIEYINTDAGVELAGVLLPCLRYQLLPPPHAQSDSNCLIVTASSFTGLIQCTVPSLDSSLPDFRELAKALNETRSVDAVGKYVQKLRILVLKERYAVAAAPLPLRLLTEDMLSAHLKRALTITDERIQMEVARAGRPSSRSPTTPSRIPPDRLAFQFCKEEAYFLVLAFLPDPLRGVRTELYLLNVNDEQTGFTDSSRLYLTDILAGAKWKSVLVDDGGWTRGEVLSGCMADGVLTSAMSAVDETLCFLRIMKELEKKGISCDLIREEENIGGMCLRINDVPAVISASSTLLASGAGEMAAQPSTSDGTLDDSQQEEENSADSDAAFYKNAVEFAKSLIRCCLRMEWSGGGRSRVSWNFDCTTAQCPLSFDLYPLPYLIPKARTWATEISGNMGVPQPGMGNNPPVGVQGSSTSASEAVSQILVQRLAVYSALYKLVSPFSTAYKAHYNESCSVIAYTYHKLVLAYGPNRDQLMFLTYKPRTPKQSGGSGASMPGKYVLTFGQQSGLDKSTSPQSWNGHVIASRALNERINRNKDLVDLVNFLVTSQVAYRALSRMNRNRFTATRKLHTSSGASSGSGATPTPSGAAAGGGGTPSAPSPGPPAAAEINPLGVELKQHLIVVNECEFRLLSGNTHLELIILKDNQLAVRDCARGNATATGLFRFCQVLEEPDRQGARGESTGGGAPHGGAAEGDARNAELITRISPRQLQQALTEEMDES